MGTKTMTRRRIIWHWAALIALVISSCGKNDPQVDDDPWEPLTGDTPISFTTQIGAETKTATPLPTHADFRVFAFYQPGVVDDDPAVDYTGTWNDLAINHWTPNFMFDQAVSFNAGTSKWTYSPIKYWPNNPENTITFWAYSPYYGNEEILKLYEANSTEEYDNDVPGAPEIQFTSNGSQDLLVSELAQDLSYRGGDPADGTVSLVFHHTMTWVDFKVKKTDNAYTVKLKSITLQNLCQTAVYKLDGWGNGWNLGNYSPYDCGGGEGYLFTDGEYRTFPTGETKLLLIPQTLRNTTATLQVVYSLNNHEYTESVQLGSLTTLWEEGKHYTYYINISPGRPILFTAVVAAWGPEQNGYFIVN